MKKIELLTLWAVFERLQQEKTNVKFSYAIAKNKIQMRPEVEALEEARKPSEKFVEYEQKRIALAKELADRDETGKIKAENDRFIISEKMDQFNEKLEVLQKEYKDSIEEREKQIKEYNSILEEEIYIKLYKIKVEHLPDEIEAGFVEVFVSCGLIDDE